MPKPGSKGKTLSGGGQSLTDRVRDRVAEAATKLDRRDRASRPRIRPAGRPKRAASAATTNPERESKALRAVYLDLGNRYRQYRERTGTPVSKTIQTAARAFKADPSLVALVPVAGFLDELSLLDW